MSNFILPEWAKENEENNNLFNLAVANGAVPGGLLFKSSAVVFLEAKRQQGKHLFELCKMSFMIFKITTPIRFSETELLNVVTDARLKYFKSDVASDVKSKTSAKIVVRQAYSNTCLLCGKTYPPAQWPLTVAHIVEHSSELSYAEFNPPRYADVCDPASIRNRVLLCGNKTDPGSCNNLFDYHNVIIYYDGLTGSYKSLCLVPMANSAYTQAREVRTLSFPQSLKANEYPYRRLLAWRIREATLRHAATLAPSDRDMLVRMSEFSEAAEIAQDEGGDEDDDEDDD
jgi:hypothetical protein